MPTPVETRVLQLLTAIDPDPAIVAAQILELGTPGVTVLCDVALATFPGLRKKIRTNATALLGWVEHPQADETLALVVTDPDRDVAMRAMRAVARRRVASAVPAIALVLARDASDPLVAAEAVKALGRMESPEAAGVLAQYVARDRAAAHRDSPVVRRVLSRLG